VTKQIPRRIDGPAGIRGVRSPAQFLGVGVKGAERLVDGLTGQDHVVDRELESRQRSGVVSRLEVETLRVPKTPSVLAAAISITAA
jgi:hypothetical protein